MLNDLIYLLRRFLLDGFIIAVSLLVVGPDPVPGLVPVEPPAGAGLLGFGLVHPHLRVGGHIDKNRLEVFFVLGLILEKCMFQ